MQPSELPEWALLDVLDPLSGQYNVVEPPQEVKNEGWRIGEKPNRQWWNWYNRTVYDWIVYFNSIFSAGAATSQSLIPVWDGFTVQPSVNFLYYSVIGDKCFINGNIQWSGNADTTNPVRINNLPFLAKNVSGFLQCLQLERGSSATQPNGKTIYANTNANTSNLLIRETDLTTGISIDTVDQGASGTWRFSGFYLIEP